MFQAIHPIDWTIIGCYIALCCLVAVITRIRDRNKQMNSENFFLAGRNMNFMAVGLSLFASNIGSQHFIGLAGSGSRTGVAVSIYEIHATWIIMLLSSIFLPIYVKSGIFTMPEYLEKRYESNGLRLIYAFMTLILSVVTKVAVDLYAGSLLLETMTGLNMYIGASILCAASIIYASIGGLKGIMVTDSLQTIVMIIGNIILAILAFTKIGGLNNLWKYYDKVVDSSTALNNSISSINLNGYSVFISNKSSFDNVCYDLPSNWNKILRGYDDNNYPLFGALFASIIPGIWYWCTDQTIVQRVMGAKSNFHAEVGTLLCGTIKLLPLFLMVMPGMVSRVFNADIIACSNPKMCTEACNNPNGCSDLAYPLLVNSVTPKGLKGIIVASMIAACMSGLSSASNSIGTVFTVDIWRLMRKRASENEKIWVGRILTILSGIIGVIWIPILKSNSEGQLFVYLQALQSYTAPAICVIFIGGILWKRATKPAAISTIIVGITIGLIRFICDIVISVPKCNQMDTRNIFIKMHFLHFALFQAGCCCIVLIVVSLFTKPIYKESIRNLSIDATSLFTKITSLFTSILSSNNLSINNVKINPTVKIIQNLNIKDNNIAIKQNEITINYWSSTVPSSESSMDNDAFVKRYFNTTKYQRITIEICRLVVLAILISIFVYYSI